MCVLIYYVFIYCLLFCVLAFWFYIFLLSIFGSLINYMVSRLVVCWWVGTGQKAEFPAIVFVVEMWALLMIEANMICMIELQLQDRAKSQVHDI